MSTAALPHVSSPDDEDLANLYHQVLAGFAEEAPAADQTMRNSEGELETLYNNYGEDGGDTPTTTRQQSLTMTPPMRSGTSPLAYFRPFQVAQSNRPRPPRYPTFSTTFSSPSLHCTECAVAYSPWTTTSTPHTWATDANADSSAPAPTRSIWHARAADT
ncbi:uncharacterized protein B0H18DRAFT_305210 [Fomitopsis serialis]|uniref:uncharacterized protein n=1 Tax=Fomitopsis serialis TaxID=139415 RepID=UPI0020080B61|nr:uncharacterized protein B0H18DRAFT_305210 [Neoantrodia serialis]KAH9926963.1 hypothetical protein B0H18DRAFT_305210 [Neoantrodia serialis]